jgi:hypothetical protein
MEMVCKGNLTLFFYQALNLHTNSEQRLQGPIGQVHALVVFNDMLLGGDEVRPFIHLGFLFFYGFICLFYFGW